MRASWVPGFSTPAPGPAAIDGPTSHTTSTAGATVPTTFDTPVAAPVSRLDAEVVELPLLLPRWQALELEAVANRRGMTTGQFLRRVLGEMLASRPTGRA